MRRICEPNQKPYSARPRINKNRITARNNKSPNMIEQSIIKNENNAINSQRMQSTKQIDDNNRYFKYAIFSPGSNSLENPLEYVKLFLTQFKFNYEVIQKREKIYIIFNPMLKLNEIPRWIYILGSFLDSKTALY